MRTGGDAPPPRLASRGLEAVLPLRTGPQAGKGPSGDSESPRAAQQQQQRPAPAARRRAISSERGAPEARLLPAKAAPRHGSRGGDAGVRARLHAEGFRRRRPRQGERTAETGGPGPLRTHLRAELLRLHVRPPRSAVTRKHLSRLRPAPTSSGCFRVAAERGARGCRGDRGDGGARAGGQLRRVVRRHQDPGARRVPRAARVAGAGGGVSEQEPVGAGLRG